MHLLAPESSIDGNHGSALLDYSSLHNYEPNNRGGSFQDPGSDSPVLASSFGMVGGWSQTTNSNVMHFATSMASSIPILGGPLSQTRQPQAGFTMQENTGRVGGNHGLNNCVPPLGSSYAASPAERLGPRLLTRGNSWSALDVLNTVASPLSNSSGVQSLQGAGIATSHCLPRFSSNPGFAEPVANFSYLSNGNYYSQTPYSLGSDGVTSGGRSMGGDKDGKISRSFSCSRLASLVPSKITDVRNSYSSAQSKISSEIESCPLNDKATTMEQAGREIEKSPAMHDDKKLQTRIGDISTSMEAFEGATETGGPRHETDEHDGPEHSSCSEQAHGDRTQARGRTDYIGKRKLSQADDDDCKEQAAYSVAGSAGRDNGRPTAAAADSDETTLVKRMRSGEITKEGAKFQTDPTFNESYSGESSPLSMKESTKVLEPPKQDYIHVRARRGEATDSHSLAERVRREKISERMKYLQELVPGCNKVTGKAVMLDEIINYVQSLQLQVEFLSMKLAAVNPRLDFDVDKFLAKEAQSLRASTAPPILLMDPDPTAMSYDHQRRFQQLRVHNLHSVESSDLGDFRPLDSAFDASLLRTMTAAVSTPLYCLDAFADNLSQEKFACGHCSECKIYKPASNRHQGNLQKTRKICRQPNSYSNNDRSLQVEKQLCCGKLNRILEPTIPFVVNLQISRSKLDA